MQEQKLSTHFSEPDHPSLLMFAVLIVRIACCLEMPQGKTRIFIHEVGTAGKKHAANWRFDMGDSVCNKTVILEFSKIEASNSSTITEAADAIRERLLYKGLILCLRKLHSPGQKVREDLQKFDVSSYSYDYNEPPNLKSEVDHFSRLYLIGHGNQTDMTFATLTTEALAEAIIEDCKVRSVMKIILISCGIGGLGVKGVSFAKDFHYYLGTSKKHPLRTSVYAYDANMLVSNTGIFVDVPTTFRNESTRKISFGSSVLPARKRKVAWQWHEDSQIQVENPDYKADWYTEST